MNAAMNALYILAGLDAVLGICTLVSGKIGSEEATMALASTTVILTLFIGFLGFVVAFP